VWIPWLGLRVVRLASVAYDLEGVALEVLERGLPEVPSDLAPDGSTVPVARATWGDFGAVLFVRRWRNGQWDCDTAVTRRDRNGKWLEPSGYGGGPWIETGLRRPAAGWDGFPIVWMGSAGCDLERDDGEYDFIVGYRAAAAATVAAVRVEQGDVNYTAQIASSAGAVIVLAYGDRPARLSALDATGSVMSYGDGTASVETFRAAS
jgi:hypothetical protein